MRIGLVAHNVAKGDGQGRVNYEVAHAALRAGHQVTLVASEIAPELASHRSASWVRIPVARWPIALVRDQVFAWRSSRWLRRHRHRLDLVHVNGCVILAASDVNSAHFVHGSWLRSPVHTARLRRDLYGAYHWLYTALNARWEKRAYSRARVVVAVSEKIRNELLKIGIPNEQIHVIQNGVDLQEFSPGLADRNELGLPGGVPLALFVGDIKTPRKNLDTALDALIKVPELHLAVAGSTEGSLYPQLAGQLELAPRIHFLGYRRDVPQLMRAADLFVFPSRYEPFGLVVLEAMASGLPVITATTAGVDDLVSAECGVVIDDPNDASALAVALKRLVQDLESRKKMGQAARAVAERHSWQQMSERYLGLYEEIVNHKGIYS